VSAELLPGQTLGKYLIRAQLGQGGMATVYRAEQPTLDRMVALKVIRSGSVGDPEFRERFQREARASARLDHPNIVQVYDFDQIEERAFLAMQLLEGGTLRDRVVAAHAKGQRLPRAEAARIVEQVAAGLAYAHRLGIVHRDIKPSNIMFSREGRAVVGDFGIARMLGATQAGAAQLTQTGVGIGTPEYMSPEQVQGTDLDARSDEYALGIVAYELLTGRPPFVGETPFTIILKQVREPLPPPSSFDPTIGQRTERVLLKALAKDPAHRFPGTEEFASALTAALAADGTFASGAPEKAASPAPALPRHPPPLAVVGVASILVMALAIGGGRVLGVFGDGGGRPAGTPAPTSAPTLAAAAPPSATGTPSSAPAAATAAPSASPSSPVPSAAPASTTPPTAPPTQVRTAVPATPVPPPQTLTPTAAATPSSYRLGQVAALKWGFDGENSIEVTVHQVVDPATPSSGVYVDPADRLVAFRLTIKNIGPEVYDEYPSELAEAIDAQGRQYAADASDPVSPGFDRLRIGPGVAIEAYISFELPKTVVVRGFLFSASFFEGDSARWTLD